MIIRFLFNNQHKSKNNLLIHKIYIGYSSQYVFFFKGVGSWLFISTLSLSCTLVILSCSTTSTM